MGEQLLPNEKFNASDWSDEARRWRMVVIHDMSLRPSQPCAVTGNATVPSASKRGKHRTLLLRLCSDAASRRSEAIRIVDTQFGRTHANSCICCKPSAAAQQNYTHLITHQSATLLIVTSHRRLRCPAKRFPCFN